MIEANRTNEKELPVLPVLCDGEYYCLWEREGKSWVPMLVHNPGQYFVSNAMTNKRNRRIEVVRLTKVLRVL